MRAANRTDALLGILTGIVADGVVNDHEILFLRGWLAENHDLRCAWPGSVISRRLDEILADGRIDDHEREHLADLITRTLGGNFAEDGVSAPQVTQLPIDDTVAVALLNASVCHSGTFYYGTRSACERATASVGGVPVDRITRKTHVLVIGANVSPSWANTSFGRKIEAAVALRDDGHPLAIISEKRWLEAIDLHQVR